MTFDPLETHMPNCFLEIKHFGTSVALHSVAPNAWLDRDEFMKSQSMELIYKAVNVIASRKRCAETEQRVADAIECELFAINQQVVPAQRKGITPLSTPVQAGIAA